MIFLQQKQQDKKNDFFATLVANH